MTAPTQSGDRSSLRALAAALAATAAFSVLALAVAVAIAPDPARNALLWCGIPAAVLLSAAVASAAHAVHTRRLLRRRLEGAAGDIARLTQQRDRQTEDARREQQRLINELAAQRVEFKEERQRLEREGAGSLDELRSELESVHEELEQARRERAAAVSATSNAAARMQALATATLADLRAMEDRHTDEDVLTDLLHLDHRTAQAGRLADSIAVLTGARSGRRWARPIALESILRGAMGRIGGYRRVRVHSTSDAAVAGHAAEGVMHALAELLDNATNFSPPTAEVHVYVEEVPAGVIVSVEDSGLVMGDVQLRRAEKAVTGDVSGLGGLTGTRLGLAVVGRLSRKHGLKVSFRPSARGGTGVLMLVPQEILTSPVPPERVPPTALPAPVDVEPEESEESDTLPRRRRGRTLAEAERSRSSRSATPAPAPDPAEAKTRAARFTSFRKAVRPSGGPGKNTSAEPSESARPTTSTGTGTGTGAARITATDTASDASRRDGTPHKPPAGAHPHGVTGSADRADRTAAGPRPESLGSRPQGTSHETPAEAPPHGVTAAADRAVRTGASPGSRPQGTPDEPVAESGPHTADTADIADIAATVDAASARAERTPAQDHTGGAARRTRTRATEDAAPGDSPAHGHPADAPGDSPAADHADAPRTEPPGGTSPAASSSSSEHHPTHPEGPTS
ncbi:ATP-binding protein [Streptomyces sp. NPDC059575]|uniref:ATP-binding protein n=1 Tax=Streptomyces sp. NPDC059575 TaxID=3346872 RepID=UPI00369B0E50